jgi:hypothetical protein
MVGSLYGRSLIASLFSYERRLRVIYAAFGWT